MTLRVSHEHGRVLFHAPQAVRDSSFSIVVCTRNRAAKLLGSLESIVAAMQTPDVKSELVVVDNGSSDDTAKTLRRWVSRQSVAVRLAEEPTPGLSRARNTGVAASSGEVIVMTDDDCVMAPDYLVTAAKLHFRPQVIGGKVQLGDERDAHVSVRLGDEPKTYDGRRKPSGFVIGANLTFHRSVFETVGAFDVNLGAGTRFGGAEDSDFAFRAWLAGFPVIYDPRLVIEHFHGRRDPDDVARLIKGYDLADGALYVKHWRTLRPFRYVAQAVKMRRWRLLRHVTIGAVMALSGPRS